MTQTARTMTSYETTPIFQTFLPNIYEKSSGIFAISELFLALYYHISAKISSLVLFPALVYSE